MQASRSQPAAAIACKHCICPDYCYTRVPFLTKHRQRIIIEDFARAMAYTIAIECVGCTMCLKKCPVDAIVGESKQLHVILPDLCIDCGVCGTYCPVNCIYDEKGEQTFKIKPKERPIAIVDIDNCTGCEFCVDVCPFDCLAMGTEERAGFFKIAQMVNAKECVACRLCEEVCMKDAIVVRWPDGEPVESLQAKSTALVEAAAKH